MEKKKRGRKPKQLIGQPKLLDMKNPFAKPPDNIQEEPKKRTKR